MFITQDFVSGLIKPRNEYSHKGDYGRVAVVAGSESYPGAAALCTRAAARTGAGLITLCSIDKVCDTVAAKNSETTYVRLESKDGAISAQSAAKILSVDPTAFVIGCGLSKTPGSVSVVKNIISAARRPILLDADGLNSIASDKDVLLCKKSELVITPHPGEMSRLTGKSVAEIEQNREAVAAEFAKAYDCVTVLKGHETIVAAPSGEICTNTTGNAGMARGGSGDILAGMIGAFLAQGMQAYNAAACGVYLHGLAGDIAAEQYTQYAMLPDDLLNSIPQAFAALF